MSTLIHEMTHMMMHDVLDLLPMWFIEGSAEYTACIPYSKGEFEPPLVAWGISKLFEQPVIDENGRRLPNAPRFAMDKLLLMNSREWTQQATGRPTGPPDAKPDSLATLALYRSSLLLTYYFMNVEGDGKGTHLLQYLEAVRSEQPRWNAWREELFRHITAKEEFLKKPEVKKLPDGTYSYPSYLSPPPEPKPSRPEYATGEVFKIHLPILLNGRTPQQIASEASAAAIGARIRLR